MRWCASARGDGAARLSFTQQDPGNDEIDGGCGDRNPQPQPQLFDPTGLLQAIDRRADNSDRRAQDQDAFGHAGKVFGFAMAVAMTFIRRARRNAQASGVP